MALTKFGYTGTVNQDQWADLMGTAALAYAMRDVQSWVPTAVPGQRSVSLAPGFGVGHGVGVLTDTAEVIALPTPAAGRWDLITMRRDWTNPSNTGFVRTPHETLTAATTQTVPPTTWPATIAFQVEGSTGNAGSGVDHQPVAWVWVSATNTTLTVVNLLAKPLAKPLRIQLQMLHDADAGAADALAKAFVQNVTSTTRPASPVSGQVIYETDTDNYMQYRSSVSRWQPLGIPNVTSDAQRSALYPTPVAGNKVWRRDKRYMQEYNGSAWRPVGSGLIPIIPSGVAGSGFALDADGRVTVTSLGTGFATLLGAFPTDFENFRLELTGSGGVPVFRIGNGPTPEGSNNYMYHISGASNAAAAIGVSGSSPHYFASEAGVGEFFTVALEIRRPNITKQTLFSSVYALRAATHLTGVTGGQHNVATAYDSLAIAASQGTFTGTARLFGYN